MPSALAAVRLRLRSPTGRSAVGPARLALASRRQAPRALEGSGWVREMGKPTAGILRQRWAAGSDKSGSDPAALLSERLPLGGSNRSPGGGGTERKAIRFRTKQNNGQRAR